MNDGGLATLLLFLIALALAISLFEYTVRRLLGVERRKWFSYNHINERHKKADWTVRIIFLILIFISTYYTFANEETVWYFDSWFVIFIFLMTSETLRATMEWKYTENKKAPAATILVMLFAASILLLTITTGFFGLFAI